MTAPDVLGREEVAALLKVSVQRTQQLERDDVAFPESKKLARGRVWDGPEIRAYAKDRRRPDPKHTKVLQSYRKTGNISHAARTAGVDRSTARRVLVAVGAIPSTHDDAPG